MAWQAGGGRRRPRDPPGGRRPCGAGLLTAFVLCSSFLLAQGQLGKTAFYEISISVNPPETLEGRTVNLSLTHEGSNFAVCNWYRETDTKENLIVTLYLPPIVGNTTGPFYTGRQVAGYGCSLLLQNLNVNDSGNYMVTMKGPSVDGHGVVNIEVLEPLSQPVLWASENVVARDANVTLNCSTSNSSSVDVTWSKDSQPFPTNVEFDYENRILTLLKFQPPDAGTYTCTAQHRFDKATSNPCKLTLAYEEQTQLRMSPAAIAGTTIGSLAGLALCVIVVYFLLTKVSCLKKQQPVSNGNIPSASSHSQPTDTKPKWGEEDIQYSTLAFNSKTTSQPPSKSPVSKPLDSGTIYSEVKKK